MTLASNVPDARVAGIVPGGAPRFTLRAKGMVLFVVLSLYVVGAASLLVREAGKLVEQNRELRALAVAEASVTESSARILRLIVALGESSTTGAAPRALATARHELDAIEAASGSWRAGSEALHRELKRTRDELAVAGTDIARTAEVLHRVESAFAQRGGELRRQVRARDSSFRGSFETVIWVAVVVSLLGLVTFGAFLGLFLGRIARDIGRLQDRAMGVVHGYRGPALEVARDDEIGNLMLAVNRMAADLDAREREISLGRVRQFHQERMALLGGIAAGVAHEIGNPVAAISAIAEELSDAGRRGDPVSIDARALLDPARRLASITRRMSEAAGTRSRELGPLELNSVVESIGALIGFDRRFKRIAITLDLDRTLALVSAVEDDVVQTMLNLLLNAAEALADATGREPQITLATRKTDDWAELTIGDNGRGMDAESARRAFEMFFTTKPSGRGNGLGLNACRENMARCGGTIDLDPVQQQGARFTCRFRMYAADAAESSQRGPGNSAAIIDS